MSILEGAWDIFKGNNILLDPQDTITYLHFLVAVRAIRMGSASVVSAAARRLVKIAENSYQFQISFA